MNEITSPLHIDLPPPVRRHAVPEVQQGRSIVAFDPDLSRGGKTADERILHLRVMPRPLRLGHVHVKVRDLNRSVPFYTRLLGLRLTEWAGRYAFLAMGEEHHSLALEEIGVWATAPSRYAVGVAHVAFQAADGPGFAAIRKKLIDANLPVISRNNGISWAMRFKDPDGNEIEIYLDRRHSPGGTKLWGGRWRALPLAESKAKLRIPAAA